jgi:hypothetical protein
MSDLDDNAERGRKERSPSFPFISLPKAVDRAQAFYDAHRRNGARLVTVAETWGYAQSSSGLQQTVGALKSYGLLEDVGRGQDRRIQLTDLANRILHDTRPGAKEASIKEAALRPRLFAEYAEKWLPNRPSDNHCLSELHLDRGFTPAAAQTFLRAFDETVTFANLKDEDSLSLVRKQAETSTPNVTEGITPPMTGLRATGPNQYSTVPPQPAVGDTMSFALAGGGVQITANIKTLKGAEDLIKLMETVKLLVSPADSFKRPEESDTK